MQLNGNKNALLGGNLGGNNFVSSGKLGNSGNFGASMNLGNGANYGAGSNFGANNNFGVNSNFGSTGVNKFANFPTKGSDNFDNGDKFDSGGGNFGDFDSGSRNDSMTTLVKHSRAYIIKLVLE